LLFYCEYGIKEDMEDKRVTKCKKMYASGYAKLENLPDDWVVLRDKPQEFIYGKGKRYGLQRKEKR
jgi:hypothetical protein